jgi:hypothetical protein
MKNKKLLLVLFVSIFSVSYSQSNPKASRSQISVENNIFGLQTGLFGAWAYNETKLSDKIALRSEIGLNLGLFGGSFYPKTGYVFYPTVTIEPRFYYNLDRRGKLNKKTSNNSANFFSLKTSYASDLFAISNYDIIVDNHITAIPKYGIRRGFGKNFEFEFSAGIGYGYNLESKISDTVLDLGFRIGYRF